MPSTDGQPEDIRDEIRQLDVEQMLRVDSQVFCPELHPELPRGIEVQGRDPLFRRAQSTSTAEPGSAISIVPASFPGVAPSLHFRPAP